VRRVIRRFVEGLLAELGDHIAVPQLADEETAEFLNGGEFFTGAGSVGDVDGRHQIGELLDAQAQDPRADHLAALVATLVQGGVERGGVGPQVEPLVVLDFFVARQVVIAAAVLETQLIDHVGHVRVAAGLEEIEHTDARRDPHAEGGEIDAPRELARVLGIGGEAVDVVDGHLGVHGERGFVASPHVGALGGVDGTEREMSGHGFFERQGECAHGGLLSFFIETRAGRGLLPG